jgi:hypothetical protein
MPSPVLFGTRKANIWRNLSLEIPPGHSVRLGFKFQFREIASTIVEPDRGLGWHFDSMDDLIRKQKMKQRKTQPMSSNLISPGFSIGDSVALARTAAMAGSMELFAS